MTYNSNENISNATEAHDTVVSLLPGTLVVNGEAVQSDVSGTHWLNELTEVLTVGSNLREIAAVAMAQGLVDRAILADSLGSMLHAEETIDREAALNIVKSLLDTLQLNRLTMSIQALTKTAFESGEITEAQRAQYLNQMQEAARREVRTEGLEALSMLERSLQKYIQPDND